MEIFKYSFVFLIYISVSHGANYLTTKPDFLTGCRIQDTQCLKNDIQNVFSNWRAGYPGLSHLGSIDPFKVKKVRLHQRAEGVADLHLEMRNVLVTGLADTKVSRIKFDEKDLRFQMDLLVPLSKLASDYKLKGRVLLLNLDGRGKMQMELSDVSFTVMAKTNLVKRGDEYFFDVISINTFIKNIGNFRIHLSNLFSGNKELENSAHDLFNGNWRSLFEALRPGITQTFDAILLDRCKRVFDFIPARYFISNLPIRQ